MKIALLAPTHSSFIKPFLYSTHTGTLPDGYFGAPFLGSLIKEYLRMGHQVVSITTSLETKTFKSPVRFEGPGFVWIVVPTRPHTFSMNGKRLGKILDFFRTERRMMLKELKNVNVDLVHAHWSYEFTAVAKQSGLPYLATIHDNPYQIIRYMRNPYRFGRLWMSEWALKGTEWASTVSPYMQKYAQRRTKNLKVIPNPIDIILTEEELSQVIKVKYNQLQEPQIVAIMNGWDKRKNGDTLLMAFKEILKRLPSARLHLFGSETGTGEIAETRCKVLELGNVVFHGKVERDILLDAVKGCHLMLHPSLEESFGVVLLEAMVSGCVVMGGENSGAVPWVINNDDLLVNVKDPSLMAQKALELLHDGQAMAIYAKQLYINAVERFSSSNVAESYVNYYKEICS